jgi:hypothetical protein
MLVPAVKTDASIATTANRKTVEDIPSDRRGSLLGTEAYVF